MRKSCWQSPPVTALVCSFTLKLIPPSSLGRNVHRIAGRPAVGAGSVRADTHPARCLSHSVSKDPKAGAAQPCGTCGIARRPILTSTELQSLPRC